MVWAAITEDGRSPPFFVEKGMKMNAQNYTSDVLEGCLHPWASLHFKNRPWTFQQDSAPSHAANLTQEWLRVHVPALIAKDEWPPASPDLNPLDFCVWSILSNKVSTIRHSSVESLKVSLLKAWEEISQDNLRTCCTSFRDRLNCVINAKGRHFE